MMNILKQLSVKQQQILKILTEEVQNMKDQLNYYVQKSEQQFDIRSQSSSAKSQTSDNYTKTSQTKLKTFSADRYIKMCYLMLREGLYGIENKPNQSPNIETIIKYLKFYKQTYQFASIPSLNNKKIKIFSPIHQDQMSHYLSKEVIHRIQKLALQVHLMFEQFFLGQGFINLCQNQQSQILYLNELTQIVRLIQKNYCWDHWRTKKIDKQSSDLTMHKLLFLSEIIQSLKILYKTQDLSSLKQRDKKKLQENVLPSDLKGQKKKQPQIENSINEADLISNIQKLNELSQVIDKKPDQMSFENTIKLGYLKQKIKQFNYGSLGSIKSEQVTQQYFQEKIKNIQINHYFNKKRTDKKFLQSFSQVYNKHSQSEVQRYQKSKESK